MNFPLYDAGLASGLLVGILFGYILENAGFGSPCKLTAQFRLRDWSVFKVMFTAIVVAAIGLLLFKSAGIIKPNSYFTPTTFLWATLLGGVLIGAGFAVGGYCPGTSVVGLFSGRFDALVFMLGMLVGIGSFAGVHESLQGLLHAAAGPRGQTLSQLLGIPDWGLMILLVVAAVAGFWLARRFESRGEGPLDAETIRGHAPQPRHEKTAGGVASAGVAQKVTD